MLSTLHLCRRVALVAAASLSVALASALVTPTASAAPTTIKMGAATIDSASFATFDTQAGKFTSRRTFNSTLPSSFARSLAATDVAAGRTSYWSFRPNPKTFPTDTTAQAAFSAFLDTIPAGHQTVIIALHEPEDEIRAGSYTLAEWGATNTVVGKIVHSKNRPELRHGISLMGPWTFDNRSAYYAYNWTKYTDFNYVDVVGIDPYKFRSGDPSLEQMLTKANCGDGTAGVASTMQRLTWWGKPIAITEFGVNARDRYTGAVIPDGVRAQWITDAYAWMKRWNASSSVQIEAAMYFQIHDDDAGPCLTGAPLAALDATTP